MKHGGTLTQSHRRVRGQRPKEVKYMRDTADVEAGPEAKMGKGHRLGEAAPRTGQAHTSAQKSASRREGSRSMSQL